MMLLFNVSSSLWTANALSLGPCVYHRQRMSTCSRGKRSKKKHASANLQDLLQVQSFQRRMVNHMVSDSLTPLQSHKGLLSGWVFSGMFPLPKLIRSQECKVVNFFSSSSIRHPSRNLILRIEVNSDKPSPRIGWSRGSISLAKLCGVVQGSESPICFNYCSVEIWWSIMEHEQLIYTQFLCLKKLFVVRVDQPSYGKSLESTEVSSATRTLTVKTWRESLDIVQTHASWPKAVVVSNAKNIPVGCPLGGGKNIQERHFSKCWAALKLADALQQSGNKWDSRRLLLESISTWAVMLPANIAVHIVLQPTQL